MQNRFGEPEAVPDDFQKALIEVQREESQGVTLASAGSHALHSCEQCPGQERGSSEGFRNSLTPLPGDHHPG